MMSILIAYITNTLHVSEKCRIFYDRKPKVNCGFENSHAACRCCLVHVGFLLACSLILKMEAIYPFETSLDIHQIALYYIRDVRTAVYILQPRGLQL
jgi:hypothetical protein